VHSQAKNTAQVVHTHPSLTPSSLIWYQPKCLEGNGSICGVQALVPSELCLHLLLARSLGNGNENHSHRSQTVRVCCCWLSATQSNLAIRLQVIRGKNRTVRYKSKQTTKPLAPTQPRRREQQLPSLSSHLVAEWLRVELATSTSRIQRPNLQWSITAS